MFKGEDSVIGRTPVMPADGAPLMPCKPAMAFKPVKSDKAFQERGRERRLKLRFNPRSPIGDPQAVVQPKADLSSSFLARVRREAQRRKVWFRLCNVERAILDLTIKCVKKPKSPRLIDILARIVVKIKLGLMSPLQRLMGQIGKPLAEKISTIAKGWGNREAEKWAEDKGFIVYLTIISKTFQEFSLTMVSHL